MRKFVTMTAAVALMIPTAAFADGPSTSWSEPVVTPPTYNVKHDGFYVGGSVGTLNAKETYYNVRDKVTRTIETLDPETEKPTTTTEVMSTRQVVSEDATGENYGFHVGYQHRYDNNLVMGVEAEHLFLDAEGSVPCASLGSCSVEFENATTVRMRGGFVLGNDLLVVGNVGYSWVNGDTSVGNFNSEGLSYGAGVEYEFDNGVSLGAGYTHFDLSDNNLVAAGNVATVDPSFGVWSLRVSLNF